MHAPNDARTPDTTPPLPALALSASSDRLSVAVRTHTGAVHARAVDARRQSAAMTSLLDELLAGARLRAEQLRAIHVDRGPGSYTGLRMALTFARVLARYGDVTLLASSSLELLALAAWRRHGVAPARAVRPLLDARRGRVHTVRAELRGERVVLVTPPAALSAADAAATCAPDEALLLAPSLRGTSQFAAHEERAHALPEIRAEDMFDRALPGLAADPAALEPLYLMSSYAE